MNRRPPRVTRTDPICPYTPLFRSRFRADHDDYNVILLKALADRLAEALAEHLHRRVRKEFWGFDPDESLDNAAPIAEKYRGIRPAPGYPACPAHSEKRMPFSLLDAAGNAGMELTAGFAILPTAAVSGYSFSPRTDTRRVWQEGVRT